MWERAGLLLAQEHDQSLKKGHGRADQCACCAVRRVPKGCMLCRCGRQCRRSSRGRSSAYVPYSILPFFSPFSVLSFHPFLFFSFLIKRTLQDRQAEQQGMTLPLCQSRHALLWTAILLCLCTGSIHEVPH
eukprot:47973-Pelagomonas_calceolata.AAC.2